MASITDKDGHVITEGLQGCTVCDEAITTARRIAKERREAVILHDDDGDWLVRPNGRCVRSTSNNQEQEKRRS